MLSKLTLIGMDEYTDGKIWENIKLPEGIDKTALIGEILRQGGEFPLLYPDDEYLSFQIKAFFLKWYHNFDRWVKVYNAEYNALYNVDVTTEFEGEEKSSETMNEHSTATASSDASTLSQKAAYDSSDLQNVGKEIYESESGTEGDKEQDSEGETKNKSKEYKYGNQGITMSQEMVQAELDLMYWNIYKNISEIFIGEFCVCIYG